VQEAQESQNDVAAEFYFDRGFGFLSYFLPVIRFGAADPVKVADEHPDAAIIISPLFQISNIPVLR
jgi:hypothetical protein